MTTNPKEGFTPGPWQIFEANEGVFVEGDFAIHTGTITARVEGPNYGEQMANARLIAACPTMFEFLKSIENCDTLEAAKGFARQAIEEATGGK